MELKDILECLVVNVTNDKLSSLFAKMIDCQLVSTKKRKRKESKNDRLAIGLVSMATGYESKKEMRREWFTFKCLFSLLRSLPFIFVHVKTKCYCKTRLLTRAIAGVC